MYKKFRSKCGFTLIEMLIVVALIAILVAISIPLVGKALQRSQVATDMANERGCKAAITTRLASKNHAFDGLQAAGAAVPTQANYDAAAGKLVLVGTVPTGYGKCKAHEKGYLTVTESSGTYTVKWTAPSGTTVSSGVHKAEGETSDCSTVALEINPGD